MNDSMKFTIPLFRNLTLKSEEQLVTSADLRLVVNLVFRANELGLNNKKVTHLHIDPGGTPERPEGHVIFSLKFEQR